MPIRSISRILALLTFENAAAALALLLLFPIPLSGAEEHSSSTSYGEVAGRVTFRGESPKSPIADDTGIHRNLLHVHKETHGLANVVVWLEPKAVRTPPPASIRDLDLEPVVMDQFDHEFFPRVVAVRSGQPVRFTNSDPANHNVRTSSPQRTNEFNIYTPMDGSYLRRFAPDPQQRPIRVGCDIHPWMRGWIYVFDHPWFDVTDERGEFRIRSVPDGEYRLIVRQPDIGFRREQPIRISNGRTSPVEIEISMNVLSMEKDQP